MFNIWFFFSNFKIDTDKKMDSSSIDGNSQA